MNKKVLLVGVTVIIIVSVIFGAKYFSPKKNPNPPIDDGVKIFFYSNTCPHCRNVEEYMVKNDIRNQVAFRELEVGNSVENANILIEKAKKCSIKPEDVGVPFFWDGAKCIMGDEPIIKYFDEQLKK